ncbi:MAG: 3-isopropylmalate dehydratase large subunit [archaeon]
MGTLTEEIFSNKLNKKVSAGDIVWCPVDYIMSHDTMTVLAISAFHELGEKVFDNEKIVIPFDHIVPPATIDQATAQKTAREFIKKQNITHFFQEGVCHQVFVEKGFATPGSVIIGSDSHTCTYGALGAFATGMGATDIGVAYATGGSWFRIPETINIIVNGKFKKGVYAKDLILKIIATIGVEGANYKCVEFSGSTIDNMEVHERLTLSNMAIEMGGKAGLIVPDEKTIDFLKNKTNEKIELIKPINPKYERTLKFDVNELSPMVACPHDLDNLKPVDELGDITVDEVFIGTCTNGRYEDLENAASILKGRKVERFTRTIIVPASVEIYKKAMENGFIKIFLDAGAIVGNPGCGPCLGRHQGVLAPGERAITTMNRNFKGRMGSPLAEIYAASPATCAASAITGKITDPRRFL